MNRVPWNHVKPGGVKLAMGHLLHGEAAPWNCALQTRAPGPIHTLMTCCTTHMCRVEHSFWPSLCHLTQFAVPFVQIVTTVFLQGTWFYTIFVWHEQCIVHDLIPGPWVDLTHCSLNQSEHLPTLPFDWGMLVYSVASQNLGWCNMPSWNRASGVCREPSSSEPAVLGRARFTPCTGQIHNTACSTAHVRLYPVVSCMLGLIDICLWSVDNKNVISAPSKWLAELSLCAM